MVVQDSLPPEQRVTNIVVMGIGEPTLNFEGLTRALETWNNPDGLGLGARRITISTVGYPNRIDQLAELAHVSEAAAPALAASLSLGPTQGVLFAPSVESPFPHEEAQTASD